MAKFLQTLKRYFKKPWDVTGLCASPEYKLAIPMATECRVPSPATFPIKYFVRDQRRNWPPIRKTVPREPDVEKMKKERTGFSPEEFPSVYLTAEVEEDMDTIGGGYQK